MDRYFQRKIAIDNSNANKPLLRLTHVRTYLWLLTRTSVEKWNIFVPSEKKKSHISREGCVMGIVPLVITTDVVKMS